MPIADSELVKQGWKDRPEKLQKILEVLIQFQKKYPDFAHDSEFMRKLLHFHNKYNTLSGVERVIIKITDSEWESVWDEAMVRDVLDS